MFKNIALAALAPAALADYWGIDLKDGGETVVTYKWGLYFSEEDGQGYFMNVQQAQSSGAFEADAKLGSLTTSKKTQAERSWLTEDSWERSLAYYDNAENTWVMRTVYSPASGDPAGELTADFAAFGGADVTSIVYDFDEGTGNSVADCQLTGLSADGKVFQNMSRSPISKEQLDQSIESNQGEDAPSIKFVYSSAAKGLLTADAPEPSADDTYETLSGYTGLPAKAQGEVCDVVLFDMGSLKDGALAQLSLTFGAFLVLAASLAF